MVTTVNTSYDSELVFIANTFGLSNNATIDRLVLQASQRLIGGPAGGPMANSTSVSTAAPTGANGTNFTVPGSPGVAGALRVGAGND